MSGITGGDNQAQDFIPKAAAGLKCLQGSPTGLPVIGGIAFEHFNGEGAMFFPIDLNMLENCPW